MLTDGQTSQLRTILETAERRLLATAQSAFDVSREGPPDDGRDSIDVSNTEELLSTNFRLLDREQKLLNKVREAIARLDRQEIDECESCGRSIGFRRLVARPVTTLCIDCKEELEEQERQRGEPGSGEPEPAWPSE